MTKPRAKSFRRRVGDVVKIALDDDGLVAYAIALPAVKFAILDGRGVVDASAALQRAPMFYVSVVSSAVTSGRWENTKVKARNASEIVAPPTFMQDPIHPDRFQVYENGITRASNLQECQALERTAVWRPEHVEDRIRDAYEGRENKWVKSLEIDRI